MGEMDLLTMINSLPSLIEQLGKALDDLESHEDASVDKDLLKVIEGHFLKLEASVVSKSLELEIREKAFKELESEAHLLISSREADISAKAQNLWDQLQVLKDAAVSAIAEARGDNQLASMEHTDVEDNKDIEMSSSLGGVNALHTGSEVKPSSGGVLDKDKVRPELMQFCEQMDAKGLLHYIMENNKKHITEELSLALEGATEPGRLVLASVEFYLHDESNHNKAEKSSNAIHSLRQACLVCMEAIATLLAKAKPGADDLLLSPEIKQQAKVIAGVWKPKLATDAANEASLETEAFLQLLASFRIASEFNEEELCKLVLAMAHNRRGPELCRSLGLAHKMPDLIEVLIRDEKQIDAARFIYTFELAERFPLVPLLKSYLRELRRKAQGKGGNSGNAEELGACKAVVQCIRDYDLEGDYPLEPLLRRVGQLEKAVSNDRPRPSDHKRQSSGSSAKHQESKKPRTNGGSSTGGKHGSSRPANFLKPANVIPNNPSRQVAANAAGLSNTNYPYLSTSYDYQTPSQTTYPPPSYQQRPYYYPADAAAATPPGYSNYAGGAVPAADTAAPPSSTYGNYAASGIPTAHQPYM